MKIRILIVIILSMVSRVNVADIQNSALKKDSNEAIKSSNYHLVKTTISSGGGVTSGGVYSVTSSMGQIDAGHNASGGSYQFNGGLLAQSGNDLIFKNSFEQ